MVKDMEGQQFSPMDHGTSTTQVNAGKRLTSDGHEIFEINEIFRTKC